MAARARRDPAAERRAFETLREMAERQPVRPQLRLERGSEDAALDARGARSLVHLEDAAKVAEIDGDCRLVSGGIADRLDAADDARSAAERCHARLLATGPIEHRRDVCFGAWIGNDVRHFGIVAEKPADVF